MMEVRIASPNVLIGPLHGVGRAFVSTQPLSRGDARVRFDAFTRFQRASRTSTTGPINLVMLGGFIP